MSVCVRAEKEEIGVQGGGVLTRNTWSKAEYAIVCDRAETGSVVEFLVLSCEYVREELCVSAQS